METLIKESAPTTTAVVRNGTAPTTNPDLFAFSSAMLVVFAMVAVMAVVGALVGSAVIISAAAVIGTVACFVGVYSGANLLNRWRRAHRDRSPRPPPDSGEASARERFSVSAVVAEAGAATAETGAATPAGGGRKPLPAPSTGARSHRDMSTTARPWICRSRRAW